MRKRNYKELAYSLEDIKGIIPHKGFPMRIQNYRAILTEGKEGLDAALKSPLFNKLYEIFENLEQKKFAKLVNLILDVKSEVSKS